MSNIKVLVVDGEAHIVRLLTYHLEKAGYEVVSTSTGKEALAMVESEKPNVVILELKLPDMDGLEILKTLRARPETKNLPVIILTNKSSDIDIFRGYHSGANLYLTKPFDPSNVVTHVGRILNAPLTFGTTQSI